VTDVTAEGAELFTARLADELVAVRARECVACYVLRMVHQFGCAQGLRFTLRWRDERAPRATALPRRLVGMGATCDCELLFNVWEPSAAISVWNSVVGRPEPPPRMPPCTGHRPRSTRACGNWQRRVRYG
jgi:hypothetical protein